MPTSYKSLRSLRDNSCCRRKALLEAEQYIVQITSRTLWELWSDDSEGNEALKLWWFVVVFTYGSAWVTCRFAWSEDSCVPVDSTAVGVQAFLV
eukprot:3743444-Amphidinium_carterae.1